MLSYIISHTLFILDGHKIARKLSKQISAITKVLKSILADYNSECPIIGESQVPLLDALNPSSPIWCNINDSEADDGIPLILKQNIVHCYLTKKRCEEEINIISIELNNLKSYYTHQIILVNETLQVMDQTSLLEKGYVALLNQLKWRYEVLLQKCCNSQETVVDDGSDNNSEDNYDDSSDDSDDEDETNVDDIDEISVFF